MKYTLSKKIVHKIINEEIKQTGIKVNVSPHTNLETFINVLSTRVTENNQNKNRRFHLLQRTQVLRQRLGLKEVQSL